MRGQQHLYLIEQFLPTCILKFLPGQGVEMARLNLVHKFGWLTLSRDEIEPPPCDHQIRRQPQHPISNGIAVMVIVEKPCVDIPLAQGSLYGGKIHGQTTILTTSAALSESCCEAPKD